MNEHFWSIVIEQDMVLVGLWTIKGENISVIATSSAFQWETDADLVEKTDAALTEVAEQMPEDAPEPSKAVFGVPASWVEEGRIKKPHLDKVRLVSQKLSLSPTGFVVLPEAIAHALKIREGSPLSGVIIGVGKGSLDMTVFRLGNIVGTVSVGRSTSLIEDTVEGLSRFSAGDSVPTRWLLYDGREVDLEETKQELIKADWGEAAGNLKFLHTPQIEIVGEREKVEAVSIAGASEIGNIKGIEGIAPEEDEQNVAETNDLSPEDLGFVVNQDIRDAPDVAEKPAIFGKPSVASKVSAFFSVFKGFKFRLPLGGGRKRVGVILGGAVVVLLALLVIAWLSLSRAEITIYISPKNLQDAEVIILDENIGSPDLANFTFPANAVEAEVSSEKTKPATGTKTVGDKASGRVTIRNGTADEVDFVAGTTLTGTNNLEFTLNEAVVVPEAQSPTSPGEVSAAVTAEDIGEEYNLPASESFSVANFPKSEVDAVSESEFAGGSSREARVISASDISELRDELTEELEAQARSTLSAKASGARFVEDATNYEVVDESVSGNAGDEGEEVTISMTFAVTGLVLPESQVEELSSFILKEQVPEGFSLKSEQVEADFQLVDEVGEGVWEFDVSLSANLLPSVNIDTVKKDIAGKHPKAVEEYLARIPGYERAMIVVRPNLPGFLGNIPRMAQNISVEVVAER